ncbi:HTH-type transcriptional regulator AdhR [bacterium BMS3Abin14]|nr:HTH-type transcriptional regulator AdhR [bacterium BMS3Abin14]
MNGFFTTQSKLMTSQKARQRAGDGKPAFAIGEVAREVGLSARTIRYYEEIGLLDSVSRVKNGRRLFGPDAIRRLKFIKRLKHLGLSLSEMMELEDLYRQYSDNRKVLPRLVQFFDEQLRRIDTRMENLRLLKSDILAYRERIVGKMGEG